MPAEDRKHLYLTRKHQGNNWKKKKNRKHIYFTLKHQGNTSKRQETALLNP